MKRSVGIIVRVLPLLAVALVSFGTPGMALAAEAF